jgi:hypothetical protein
MAIGITCNNPPPADVGVAYSHAFPATGDTPPDVFDIPTGALPAGLTIAAATGVVSGTPTGPAGTSAFAVRVTDSTTATATVNCSITVGGLLQIVGNPSNGYLTLPYAYSFTTLGGTGAITFQIQAGALPQGLTLNLATGAITGVPLLLGRSAFTIRATDSIGTTADIAVAITVQSTAQGTNVGPVGGTTCCN